jgi:hypothetical protein
MKYAKLLEDYISGVSILKSIISGISENDLNYRPDRPDAWTIKEHIIHLADSEVNGFIRCKSIIAQPNSECYVMDEELWTKNIFRKNEDVKKYLQLFELVRNIVFDFLKDEPEENWNKNYFLRKYKGEAKEITLEKCIELYRNHLLFHQGYIDNIKKELKL